MSIQPYIDRPASRMRHFIRGFVDHPASVNESYLGHARFALWFSGMLMLAALAALVHALVPPLCTTTASRIVDRLHGVLVSRH